MVKHGQFYIHKKTGNKYCILDVANENAVDKKKWPQIVVYVDSNRNVWARPMTEFLDKFKKGKDFKYQVDEVAV